MKKILLFLVVAFITTGTTLMGQQLADPIKNDPNVRIGKLSNGLTYYIRANKKPEKRVEFRLAVNAGSMQENEAQVGLAHFTEHMAFNGIEGYPGNTMISELQKIGVSFGGGINAYTSFDETVYEITMPTEDPKNIEFGINILKGWANGLLLDDEEINNERGIIIEEYRNGLGAQDRMRKKWFPVAFNGSRYADRLPIGTLENLQNFKPQTLKDFYKEWYRPDLQAVIVVGDINVDQVEAMIKEKFGSIPARTGQPKVMYPIPGNKTPMAVVCTDPEAGGSQVMVFNKYDYFLMKTIGDFKKQMTHQLYNMMIESRLSELQQNPNVPFIGASAGYENFIGQCDAYASSVSAKEGQIEKALETILKENNRVLKYGFLESEFKRAKEELLNNYEVASNEADKTESARFAVDYVEHFLRHAPIPGAKREFTFAKKYLQEITLEDVNDLAKQWITKENMVAVVLAPQKEGVVVPTEAKILEIINNPELNNVEAYVDTYKEQEVIDITALVPGKVTNLVELQEVGAKEYTLSNGIKVILKKTNFKNDEILFQAKSKGGMSLYPESDLPSLHFASQFIDRAGIGELNFSSLEKKMKGKKVGLTPSIGFESEGLDGSSTPKDLEFFFQYLNAFFTNPRFDPTVSDLVINETLEQMKMIKAMPMYRFIGELLGVMTQNDPYQATVLNMSEDFVKKANYERAFQLYKERFANPADFTFCFVGNFDESTMIKYLELYLGSLKTTSQVENFKTGVDKGFPKKSVRQNVYAGTEEQSFVGIALSKPIPYTPENTMIVNQISEALQIELIEVIREQMSGVYSPMLQMEASKYPNSEYMAFVMFGCNPTNTDNLSNAVMDILKNFQKNGPKPETLEKVKQQMIKNRQTNMEKNNFWLSYISNRTFNNDPLNTINNYEQSVNKVTNEDIVKFMKKYVNLKHTVRIDMYPESMRK